jgi:hypothetical protein
MEKRIMTATPKPATASEKSKAVNKKKRTPTARGSKTESAAAGSPKTSTPSAPARRKRATRRKAEPATVGKAPQLVGASADGAAAVPVVPTLSPLAREQMIAEAAYFKAQSRGFAGGNPQRDWFEAEAEVDALLSR